MLTGTVASAQKIQLKAGEVLVDGQPCLLIKTLNNTLVSYSALDGNELFLLKFVHNSRYGKLYSKVTFLNEDRSLTSQSYVFTRKDIVKKLIDDGTLKDCKLVTEKVARFIQKYDENVEVPY